MYQPPASRDRLSRWNNPPTSSALITCMAGPTLADSQAWQGRAVSSANTQNRSRARRTGNRGWIPPPKAAPYSLLAQGFYPHHSLVTLAGALPRLYWGEAGRGRALTFLSYNKVSAQPPEVSEQHLCAQKFCCKKKTLSDLPQFCYPRGDWFH